MTPPDRSGRAVPGPGSPGPAPLARRGLMAAAALTLPLFAAGCKGLGVLGTPPQPLPDVALVREAIAGEQLMIARYRAAIARSPGSGASLAAILAEHQAHLDALRARLVGPHANIPRGRAARPGPVPATAAAAIAYLRDAERAAAARLLAHLGAATPSLAQLLVSIAASESTHAAVLGSHGTHG